MKVLALALIAPLISAKIYFKETFEGSCLLMLGKSVPKRWVVSDKAGLGKWQVTAGKFFADKDASRGLQTSEDAKFYAISAPLDEVFDNKDKDLVIQFTTKHEQNIDCGGGYIKLLPKLADAKKFNGETPYSIMFGSDICGVEKKIHAILNYKGTNHLIKETIAPGSDQLTHQYTFILKPDQTFEILLDNESKASGSILEKWDLLPPKTIPDPSKPKPDDWVDEEEIEDASDVKPANWDDIPEHIVDPDAKKPEDWDDEMDGEWEAPKIGNPEYKGEWKAKMIPNPAYKGPYVQPEIANPDYVEDKNIYHSVNGHVGFDLWQVRSGTIFDNIIVTDSIAEAKEFGDKTYTAWVKKEAAAKKVLDDAEMKKAEEERKAKEAEEASKKDEEPADEVGDVDDKDEL